MFILDQMTSDRQNLIDQPTNTTMSVIKEPCCVKMLPNGKNEGRKVTASIVLKELELQLRIGQKDWERKVPKKVFFSLKLDPLTDLNIEGLLAEIQSLSQTAMVKDGFDFFHLIETKFSTLMVQEMTLAIPHFQPNVGALIWNKML